MERLLKPFGPCRRCLSFKRGGGGEFQRVNVDLRNVCPGSFSPLVPSIGSYMYVDVSQYDVGEKARFQLPVMKENDTHCIDFNYLLTSPDGSSPGTLNILVKVGGI